MSVQSISLDCCEETQPTNPKKDVFPRRKKASKGLDLYKIQNPIPEEIRDIEELTLFFDKYKLVPFAGTSKHTGHALLYWYLMLAQLSPTHSACISKKLKYAVGGRGTFIRAEDPQWDLGEENTPLTTAEKVQYRDALNDFVIFENGVTDFHRRIGWSYEATGNAWIELVYSEVVGVGKVTLKAHKVTNVLYLKSKAGEARRVAVSPIWTDDYLRKHPFREVPIYPNFEQDEDGNLRTMFHLKNGDNDWYGRPESQGSDLYKYREVQDATYLIKQAGSNFVGQLIMEIEDDQLDDAESDAQKAGFGSLTDRFSKNYTAQADDPASVVITARPFGSRPMFVFQVKPNTNEAWYQTVGDINEAKIMQSHGCTPRFMGKEVAGGFSQDVFISDYVINMEPVINELRGILTRFSNQAVTAAWIDLFNRPELNQYSISFVPPIQSQIDALKNATITPQQQPAQPAQTLI